MGRLLLLIVAMAASLAANAQYGVTCQVNDTTGEGEPYATVRIYAAADTSKVLLTCVTEGDGSFKQKLTKAGKYAFVVTAVGKTPERKEFEVSASKPEANLGTLVLHTAGNVLAGVTVSAQAPLVSNEIDRLSYNVQSDAESKTQTIFEMLRKVPLVTVDGQDNITVKGSSNFKIYKNGHPDPSMSQNPKEVLKSIPASMIKKIEVITEPGAKYDAEGVTAILNIVTVTGMTVNGVTGTVGVGVSSYGDPNVNTYLTTQVGKLVTSLNYGYNHTGSRSQRNSSESEYEYVESGNRQVSRQANTSTSTNVHYGNIESSFEPDTLNLFTLSFGGWFYKYNATSEGFAGMLDRMGNTLWSYGTHGRDKGNSYYDFSGRFDYQHKTHVKDETLTLSYLLSTSRGTTDTEQTFDDVIGTTPVAYSGYDNIGKENFAEHTLQFDWTRPFAKYHKFETGVKYIYRKNKSHTVMDYYGVDGLDTDTRFDHLTQVAAAYASYTFSKDKWSARAGLRYEYSYLSAKYPDGSQPNYHRNLGDWVPSASVNYKFSMANSLKLAFATRINRPGISYLNPAVVSTPTTESFGDSKLGSSRYYSTTVTFMHIGAKFTFNVSPTFSFTNNQICSVQYVSGGKIVSTYANEEKARMAGVGAYVQWQVFKSTSLSLNAQTSYNYEENSNRNLKAEGWSYSAFGQISQQLPWKLRVSGGGGLFKGSPYLYGHSSGNGYYYLSLQRSFLKEDRLTVRLSGSNPFSPLHRNYTSYVDRGDYVGLTKMRWVNRDFRLSVSYRFGSLNASVKKTNTTIENSDVVGGGNRGGGGGSN